MKIYIDHEFKCHTEQDGTRQEIETGIFDGKCREYIEGCLFVPAGQQYVRSDGAVFVGEMVSAWKNLSAMQLAQAANDRVMKETADDVEGMKIVRQAGITIQPKPIDLPTRPGYEWTPIQTVAGGSITWIMSSVYNPNLPGTRETPIEFEDGMQVRQNYHYIRNGAVKLWFGAQCTQPDWESEDWVNLHEECL